MTMIGFADLDRNEGVPGEGVPFGCNFSFPFPKLVLLPFDLPFGVPFDVVLPLPFGLP